MKLLSIILIFLTIALEAISEAMYDENIKAWSKVVQIGMRCFLGIDIHEIVYMAFACNICNDKAHVLWNVI